MMLAPMNAKYPTIIPTHPSTSPTRGLALFALALFPLLLACSDRTLQREGESELEWGERLFAHLGCVTCHSLSGAQLQGPVMGQAWLGEVPLRTGETAILDEDFVRRSISDPTAAVRQDFFPVMVPYLDLTEGQVDALVAFWREKSVVAEGADNE